MARLHDVELDAEELQRVLDGMREPKRMVLPLGTKLYRVEAIRRQREGKPPPPPPGSGGWWIGQKAFNKIMQGALTDPEDRGLGHAAREAAAVKYEWSNCDLLVEAHIKKKIVIFYGKGNPMSGQVSIEGNPDVPYEFKGWDDIDQWYLPKSYKLSNNEQGGREQSVEIYRTVQLHNVQNTPLPYLRP